MRWDMFLLQVCQIEADSTWSFVCTVSCASLAIAVFTFSSGINIRLVLGSYTALPALFLCTSPKFPSMDTIWPS